MLLLITLMTRLVAEEPTEPPDLLLLPDIPPNPAPWLTPSDSADDMQVFPKHVGTRVALAPFEQKAGRDWPSVASEWPAPAETGVGLIALSPDCAILQAGNVFYALSREGGLLGTFEVPLNTAWMGLGAGCVPFASAPGQPLLKAESLMAGVEPGGFSAPAQAPIANRWDVAGQYLLGVRNNIVWRSSDLGTHFTKTVLPVPGNILELAVRDDGVSVVRLETSNSTGKTLMAEPGQPFKLSPFQLTTLEKYGNWILSLDDYCSVVLSADGQRWVDRVDGSLVDDMTTQEAELKKQRSRLVETLEPTEMPGKQRDWPKPLPVFETAPTWTGETTVRTGAQKLCSQALEAAAGINHPDLAEKPKAATERLTLRGGGYSLLGRVHENRGVEYLYDRVPGTHLASTGRHTFGFFHSSRYAVSSASPPAKSPTGPDVRPASAVEGKSSTVLPPLAILGVLDGVTHRLTFLAAPPGCKPSRILTLHEQGLLVCEPEEKSTRLYRRTADSDWELDGELPIGFKPFRHQLSSSDDGTLLLGEHPSWQSHPPVFVRTPNPPPGSPRWRTIVHEDALMFVPYRNGSILIVEKLLDHTDYLNLQLDVPGLGLQQIGRPVHVRGAAMEVHIEQRKISLECSGCLSGNDVYVPRHWKTYGGDTEDGQPMEPEHFWLNANGGLTVKDWTGGSSD